MAKLAGSLPLWLRANAWREILARIFENVPTKTNVTPEWLVNPATNRRLKLDLLYPEIGVAVRFEGLEGKQRRARPSLEEEAQQQARDQARATMCRAHGIQLVAIEVATDNLQAVFQEIDMALSRAGQQARRTDRNLFEQIGRLRATAAGLARRIGQPDQLKLYAELWEDRLYQAPEPAPATAPAAAPVAFTKGMEVEHTIFGPGVVLEIIPNGDDTLVTVDFITAGQKTLAASLVGDKLHPR